MGEEGKRFEFDPCPWPPPNDGDAAPPDMSPTSSTSEPSLRMAGVSLTVRFFDFFFRIFFVL